MYIFAKEIREGKINLEKAFKHEHVRPSTPRSLLCEKHNYGFLLLRFCFQGIRNNQHFGFISRETDNYIGYVFKCESNSVADHIVSAISQSFHSMKESKERSKQPVLSCEHCPMMWYHKLCSEVEGTNL